MHARRRPLEPATSPNLLRARSFKGTLGVRHNLEERDPLNVFFGKAGS